MRKEVKRFIMTLSTIVNSQGMVDMFHQEIDELLSHSSDELVEDLKVMIYNLEDAIEDATEDDIIIDAAPKFIDLGKVVEYGGKSYLRLNDSISIKKI